MFFNPHDNSQYERPATKEEIAFVESFIKLLTSGVGKSNITAVGQHGRRLKTFDSEEDADNWARECVNPTKMLWDEELSITTPNGAHYTVRLWSVEYDA